METHQLYDWNHNVKGYPQKEKKKKICYINLSWLKKEVLKLSGWGFSSSRDQAWVADQLTVIHKPTNFVYFNCIQVELDTETIPISLDSHLSNPQFGPWPLEHAQ